MELSLDMPNLAQQFNALKRQNDDLPCPDSATCQPVFDSSDILNMSQCTFPDQETWLCYSSHKKEWDLNKWMYGRSDVHHPAATATIEFHSSSPKTEPKNIDTRTFTRPKKRYTRPSIEKYNEELYGSDTFSDSSLSSPKKLTDSGVYLNGITNQDHQLKPLHFDLSQPSSSFCFENMVANAANNCDSFQNMSPPSLVNSMCSSTFATLMENSFIKNDPELREIRDTDYTESILQHDAEPMFHSFTESFSSLNSDVPENFLKKVSLNDTFNRSFTKIPASGGGEREKANESGNCLNTTFSKSSGQEFNFDSDNDDGSIPDVDEVASLTNVHLDEKSVEQKPVDLTVVKEWATNLNGTYQRPNRPRLRNMGTFNVADVNNGTIKGNATFQRRPRIDAPRINNDCSGDSPQNTLNSTITIDPAHLSNDSNEDVKLNESFVVEKEKSTIIQEDRSIENVKRLLSRRESPSMDLNRLSYGGSEERINTTYANEQKDNIKRYSYTGSTDSGENLDYMSASSGSSKGSNKMLNMEGLNAIVEMQERSLSMSTPKMNKAQKLFENNFISPICNSDPELSSNETNDITKTVLGSNAMQKQKSLGQLDGNIAQQPPHLRSVTKLVSRSRLQGMGAIRGSYPNLKTIDSGSQPIPTQQQQHKPVIQRTSRSNLNTLGHTLKGSYTSLKPISANLPVAPPPLMNTTTTISGSRATATSQKFPDTPSKVAQVNPMPRESAISKDDVNFVKPQVPRASGLPRPVGTGIPRPVSRIPGPRNVRTLSKPPGKQPTY